MLSDHERLLVAVAVNVAPAGGAAACRSARHRQSFSVPSLVQGTGTGDLDGFPRRALTLSRHEGLGFAVAVAVVPADGAAACRTARHRVSPGQAALVQGGGAGDLD